MAREMLEKILEAEKQAEEKLNDARLEAQKIVSEAAVAAKENTKKMLEEAKMLCQKTVDEAQVLADELVKSKVEEAKSVCTSFSAALDDKKTECFEAVLKRIAE